MKNWHKIVGVIAFGGLLITILLISCNCNSNEVNADSEVAVAKAVFFGGKNQQRGVYASR